MIDSIPTPHQFAPLTEQQIEAGFKLFQAQYKNPEQLTLPSYDQVNIPIVQFVRSNTTSPVRLPDGTYA